MYPCSGLQTSCSTERTVRAISVRCRGQFLLFGPTQFQCPSGSLKGTGYKVEILMPPCCSTSGTTSARKTSVLFINWFQVRRTSTALVLQPTVRVIYGGESQVKFQKFVDSAVLASFRKPLTLLLFHRIPCRIQGNIPHASVWEAI